MRAENISTVVGVFERQADAERALDQLRAAGFSDAHIGVARGGASERVTDEGDPALGGETEGTEVGAGAAAGAVAGLGLGALAGLGVLSGMIPVIGPAIAGGTLGIVLSNAAAGAGVAGLIGALVGAGIPEHEAAYYQEEVAAGRTILTVDAGARGREAGDILRRNGAYDASNRSNIAEVDVPTNQPRRVDVPVQQEELSSGSEEIITGVPLDDDERRIL